jgi:hypothetical protein
MKLLLEIVLSIILHPISAILMWINLVGRSDLNGPQKVIWAHRRVVGHRPDPLHHGGRRHALVANRRVTAQAGDSRRATRASAPA